MQDLRTIAKRTITGAKNELQTFYHRASTDDIISIIEHADSLSKPYTTQFTAELKARHGNNPDAILRDVWTLLKSLRYKADDGHQKIKSPAQLIADGTGDCKSYSVFIGSVLKNLGIKYVYRYADYDRDNDVNHVYIIAHPYNSKPIVIDAVHTQYNREAPGANYMFDIDPDNPKQRKEGRGIAGISAISNNAIYITAGAVLLLILLYK